MILNCDLVRVNNDLVIQKLRCDLSVCLACVHAFISRALLASEFSSGEKNKQSASLESSLARCDPMFFFFLFVNHRFLSDGDIVVVVNEAAYTFVTWLLQNNEMTKRREWELSCSARFFLYISFRDAASFSSLDLHGKKATTRKKEENFPQ